MSAPGAFDGLAERLQRARADYELRPSERTWVALLEAENAWLRWRMAEFRRLMAEFPRFRSAAQAEATIRRSFQNGG